jgi:hypothetical protein
MDSLRVANMASHWRMTVDVAKCNNFTLDTCIPKDKDPQSINGGWISTIDLAAWGDSGYGRIKGDMNDQIHVGATWPMTINPEGIWKGRSPNPELRFEHDDSP